ncbi:MAG: polymer-forming cytoskeletal protein [Acidobacteria bacterium]|nr:polymer-forming cytoskeletal protein [Acidobacteriota bacterium]
MLFKKKEPRDEIVSLLGKGAEMTGEITFTNGLRVEGIIKGKVRSEAILEIGPGGKVDAEVNIRRISINGEFHGVIHASDRVEIHKDGKVFGDVFSPCLIIEAGAIFDGHCNMSNEKKSNAKDETINPKTAESNNTGKTP